MERDSETSVDEEITEDVEEASAEDEPPSAPAPARSVPPMLPVAREARRRKLWVAITAVIAIAVAFVVGKLLMPAPVAAPRANVAADAPRAAPIELPEVVVTPDDQPAATAEE